MTLQLMMDKDFIDDNITYIIYIFYVIGKKIIENFVNNYYIRL